MATLAEAVDAAETDWLVSADIPDSVDYLTVESEVVQVTATFPAQYQARDGSTSAPRIRVVRGAGGTTAASHADTTALTPLIPPSASSGAAEAGTVAVISDTEPVVTEPRMIWVRSYDDTAVTGDILYDIHIRNDADDGWLRPQLLQIVGGVLRSRVTLDGPATGGDIEVRDASGNAVLLMAWGGDGEVDIQNNAADFSWVNKLHMKAGFILMEHGDANGTGNVYLDATAVSLGATGNRSILLLGVPTSDPGTGEKVWNDAGTLKITAP